MSTGPVIINQTTYNSGPAPRSNPVSYSEPRRSSPVSSVSPPVRDTRVPDFDTRYQRVTMKWRGRVVLFVALLIIAFVLLGVCQAGNMGKSSYNREPIATGVPFDNHCIIDELGWFDNILNASRRLQNFYDKTGVQPFIYLKAYDSSLTSDDMKTEYAESWYESNIDNESTFLYMYFAEQDQDGDVGFMAYVNGKQVTSVMDAEAVDIFWGCLDNAWYKDSSTDDMFVSVFDSTAKRIMTKSTTGLDIVKYLIVILGIACVFSGVMLTMATRRQHEAERNAETERILKTDIRSAGSESSSGSGGSGDSSSSSSSSGDDLLDKWS